MSAPLLGFLGALLVAVIGGWFSTAAVRAAKRAAERSDAGKAQVDSVNLSLTSLQEALARSDSDRAALQLRYDTDREALQAQVDRCRETNVRLDLETEDLRRELRDVREQAALEAKACADKLRVLARQIDRLKGADDER